MYRTQVRHNIPTPLQVDLLTLKVESESHVMWGATCVPILVFLVLSVLELFLIYMTDRQTSDKSIG